MSAPASRPRLFGSLFIGGFECSTHLTPEGHRMTSSRRRSTIVLRGGLHALPNAGIIAVRDAARWPIVDLPGRLDRLRSPTARRDSPAEHGSAHLGSVPLRLSRRSRLPVMPIRRDFLERFVAFATAVARVVRDENDEPGWYTPVNEISYTAWAAGDVGIMSPFWHRPRLGLQVLLVGRRSRPSTPSDHRPRRPRPFGRAARPAPRSSEHYRSHERARLRARSRRFQRPGRLGGLRHARRPCRSRTLGGTREHLGVVGVNYYEGNQWTIPTPTLPQHFLGRGDPPGCRSRTLRATCRIATGAKWRSPRRAPRPVPRPGWLRHLTGEARGASRAGVTSRPFASIRS